jgi:hypothetical protein
MQKLPEGVHSVQHILMRKDSTFMFKISNFLYAYVAVNYRIHIAENVTFSQSKYTEIVVNS